MEYKNFSKRLKTYLFGAENWRKKKEWFEIKKNVLITKNHSRHISKLIDVLKSNYQSAIFDHVIMFNVIIFILLRLWKYLGVDVSCDDKMINKFLNKVCNLESDRISIMMVIIYLQ